MPHCQSHVNMFLQNTKAKKNKNLFILLIMFLVNIFGEDEASSNTSVTHSHSQSSHDSGVDTVDGGQGAKHDTSHNPHPFKQYKIEKFYRSIKSRLIVAEVIKRYI